MKKNDLDRYYERKIFELGLKSIAKKITEGDIGSIYGANLLGSIKQEDNSYDLYLKDIINTVIYLLIKHGYSQKEIGSLLCSICMHEGYITVRLFSRDSALRRTRRMQRKLTDKKRDNVR